MKKYNKSPIYYTGNKYRLLKTIEPLFPKNVDLFVDVFGGSGTVSINANAHNIVFNDIDYTFGLMKTLLSRSPEEEVKRCVELSKKYGFPQDKIVDKEKFKELFYKHTPKITKTDYDDILFWMHYAFSNKIEFKQNGYYDLSCGQRLLKPKLYLKKLQSLHSIKDKLVILNKNYSWIIMNIIKYYTNHNKFLYLDPPYLASERTRYNGWDENNEKELLRYLDWLLEQDILFGLSNSIEVRGNKNELLINWMEKNKDKVKVHYLNHKNTFGERDKTSGKANTNQEVYITNFFRKDVENGK